ncbi:MAG TPA: hypothetical protein VKY42_07115 [Trueperaceae bacterium]|mgnify:FL=1|nr:hypothetical protein [Trueperaceae bacterium]
MRTPQRALAFGAVLLLAAMVACAPSAGSEQRVEVQQLSEPTTYYPFQTGAAWQYLPEGARLSDPRASVVVEGPAVVDGGVWISFREMRPGWEQRSYRQFRADGVYLHSQVRLGITTIEYDPPMKEFPAPDSLRVGTQWSGDTTITLSLGDGSPPSVSQVNYVYTVVDRRTVQVPAGPLEVFVIDLTTRLIEDGEVAEESSRQFWYAPYVGEVRLRTGHLLVATNVPLPGAAQR